MQLITFSDPIYRRFIAIIFVVTFIFGGDYSASSSGIAFDTNELEHVDVSSDGLTIRWAADQIVWDSTRYGMVPTIDQYLIESRPGFPQLPYRSVTFAIPADSVVQADVSPENTVMFAADHQIALAPSPSGVERNDRAEMIGGRFVASTAELPLNTETVIVEEIGTIGGLRLGRAVFYPLAYQDGDLLLTQSATVDITFETAGDSFVSDALSPLVDEPSSFANAVESSVVNPQHVQPKRPNATREAAESPTTAVAVIQVAGSGMVLLNYEDLVDSGVDPGRLNPNQLAITHAGVDLSLRLMGDGDNLFEPQEGIVFYAPAYQSRWTTTAPFLLQQKGVGSKMMQGRSGTTTPGSMTKDLYKRVLVEENLLYTPECACGNLPRGWDGDRWVWKELRRPGNATANIEATLDDVDINRSAEITLWFIGFTTQTPNAATDHSVEVTLNGEMIGTVSWDGKADRRATLNIRVGLLKNINNIELELVETGGEIDGVWLDAVEFRYERASAVISEQSMLEGSGTASSYVLPLAASQNLTIYDVSNPFESIILELPSQNSQEIRWGDQGQTDAVYAVVPADGYIKPAEISPSRGLTIDQEKGADYLIIAPNEFVQSGLLEPLIEHRQGQGLTVGIETAEEIYIAFGEGDPRPEAIRDYLSWGYHEWGTRPEMVVLVGDGSSDPKQHKPNNLKTRIPPYLAEADPWIGEVAADNRFVTVDGDDYLPDIALGRLPVNSLAELGDVVNKILIYEASHGVGGWNRNLLLVTDNSDEAGDFYASSDSLIDRFISAPWLPNKLYLGRNGLSVPQVQASAIQYWKAGQGLIMFNGHSSTHQWGAERLIHIDDVQSLKNLHRLPVVMQMTCFTASFNSPTFNTLDEQLVRQADGGAIAVWGATGLGVATGHDSLSAGALDSIYGQGESTLGMATVAGKLQLVADKSAYVDLLDTFVLLGDPGLKINLALTGQTMYLPIIDR